MNLTIERAVWRVGWKLRKTVTGARTHAIQKELRANLHEAARDVGPEEAVRSLGDLDALAAAYAEVEAGRPRQWRPRAAMWWSLCTLLVLTLLNGRTLRDAGDLAERGSFDTWSASLPGIGSLEGDVEAGLLLHVTVSRAALVVLPLLVFVLTSRIWRLRPRGVPRPTRA